MSASPRRPRSEVLALYLLFRRAQALQETHQLSAGEYGKLVEELTRRIDAIWTKLFPGEDGAAHAWSLDRLELLRAEGVLNAAQVARLRQDIEPRAGRPPSKSGAAYGTVGLMWRLHCLYRSVLESIQLGHVSEALLPRIRFAIHEQALRAMRDLAAVDAHGPAAFVATLREVVESNVRSLVTAGALPQIQAAALCDGLFDGFEGGEAPVECLVCGEALDGTRPVVRCGACDTPHHQDCWKYNEGCAIFGCGSVSLGRGPGEPQAEIVFELTRSRSRKGRTARGRSTQPVFWWAPDAVVAAVQLIAGLYIATAAFWFAASSGEPLPGGHASPFDANPIGIIAGFAVGFVAGIWLIAAAARRILRIPRD